MNQLAEYSAFLEQHEILSVRSDGSVSIDQGVRHGHVLQALRRFSEVIASEELRLS
jgi:hypothetical protein